ncbi:hypothetical protein EYF80_045257 [Liparis tanakae]|uniref:Uncharacterized protein n=1 Tax=Liparis tanakae TaxID=230148 RepID=A0A4Z2FV37_9TELE|nr:hypothetical protein EYF80_045257 [Liparis tanakae]
MNPLDEKPQTLRKHLEPLEHTGGLLVAPQGPQEPSSVSKGHTELNPFVSVSKTGISIDLKRIHKVSFHEKTQNIFDFQTERKLKQRLNSGRRRRRGRRVFALLALSQRKEESLEL